MPKKLFFHVVLVLIGLVISPVIAFSAAPFYEGKVIRIIVGASPGGGFDLYARTLARHMGRQIPGNPSIIVENMPGAGHLIAANYVSKVAKPDGLTIGHFAGSLFISQLMEQKGIEFDARKFEFIGAPAKNEVVFAFTKKSGITSTDAWKASKKPPKLGGLMAGNHLENAILISKHVLGFPVQFIEGFKGTADIRMAVEVGELDGICLGWESLKATWGRLFQAGDMVVALQGVPKPFPDLAKVPLAIDFAKTDEARKFIEVGIHYPSVFDRPLLLPPGTSKEQVQLLRRAFQETLKDKEFVAEAEKAKLELNPVSGEEVEKLVAGFFNIDTTMKAKLKEIIYKVN